MKARLHSPSGVAVDRKGNVYIADRLNHRIRKVSANGRITTFAGTGKYGCGAAAPGDGGPATSAQVCAPSSIAVDRRGNVYFDSSNRVRKVDSSGTISTFAGGTCCATGDGGPATSVWFFKGVDGIAADAKGNVYLLDLNRVRKVDPSGTITTLAGREGQAGFSGDGGPATSATLNNPQGLAADAKGNVYIADNGNHRVRRVSSNGKIVTIAGTGKAGYYKEGARATSTQLGYPLAVAVDLKGNVYIADGSATVAMVSPGGRITRLAGPGTQYELGDGGPARAAWLNGANAIAVDAKGNVYIADGTHRVRKVSKP